MSLHTERMAVRMRMHALRMVHEARASHIASALSICDILAVLYGLVLKLDPAQPRWPERDRFILSKGHACVGVYAALAERILRRRQHDIGSALRSWCGLTSKHPPMFCVLLQMESPG